MCPRIPVQFCIGVLNYVKTNSKKLLRESYSHYSKGQLYSQARVHDCEGSFCHLFFCLYNLTTLCLKGPLSSVDFMDVINLHAK